MQDKLLKNTIANNLGWLMSCNPDLDTQMKISKKSGVGQSTVGRMIRGDVEPTSGSLEKVASAFKLTASNLMDPNLIARLSGEPSRESDALAGSLDAYYEDAPESVKNMLDGLKDMPPEEAEKIAKTMEELQKIYGRPGR